MSNVSFWNKLWNKKITFKNRFVAFHLAAALQQKVHFKISPYSYNQSESAVKLHGQEAAESLFNHQSVRVKEQMRRGRGSSADREEGEYR